MSTENKTGLLIKIVGCLVIIAGFAYGAHLAFGTTEVLDRMYVPPKVVRVASPFQAEGMYIMVASFISGIAFIGFGEIIDLLTKIHKSMVK